MGKIQKFIDFITGYSSYKRGIDQMANRVRNFDPQPQNSDLTPNQKVELLNMIKDYCNGISDLNGVDLRWQDIEPYSDLKSFRVKASIKIQPESQSDFDTELQSAKSQLSSEDFVLEYVPELHWSALFDGTIVVNHKSYRPPTPPKRMRRVA
jgi:hypothetical protein